MHSINIDIQFGANCFSSSVVRRLVDRYKHKQLTDYVRLFLTDKEYGAVTQGRPSASPLPCRVTRLTRKPQLVTNGAQIG